MAVKSTIFRSVCRNQTSNSIKRRQFSTQNQNKKDSTPLGAWVSPTKSQLTEFQRKLQRDARRSNLWEMKQLRTFPDGKAFPAQIYENPATAPVWPQNLFDLTATDRPAVNFKAELIGKSVRNAPVSFIVVSQKRILVQNTVKSWIDPLVERFPQLPLYEVVVMQNWLYRLINPLLRSKWESNPHTQVYYKKGGLDLEPEILGIDVENSLFAYFFLVENATQRIRWRAVGTARQGELESLSNIINAAHKHVK